MRKDWPCGDVWSWGEWTAADGGWIYAVREEGTPLIKIGYTKAKSPKFRLQTLRYSLGVPLTLIAAVWVKRWARKAEQYIHWLLRAQRIEGEWFYLHMQQALLEALVTRAVHEIRQALGTTADYLLGLSEESGVESEALPAPAA